jgi:hypothetical protein
MTAIRIAKFRVGLIPLSTSILIMMVVGGATVPEAKAQAIPDGESGWDREAAARYLDDRINLWFERATELKTGQGKTSCISCHTVVPYLLARPALRKAMQIGYPTPQEVKLFKEMPSVGN